MEVALNLDVLVLAGVAVSYATQVLKSQFVPVQFQKYPRLTAAVASLVASVVVVWQQNVPFSSLEVVDWVKVVLSILLVAAIAYNTLVKGSTPKLES